MSRYIDAEKLKDWLSPYYHMDENPTYEAIIEVIGSRLVPYEDVMEVPVRCKDCEHYEATDIRDDTIYCHQYTDYRGIDEFCSRGERRTE